MQIFISIIIGILIGLIVGKYYQEFKKMRMYTHILISDDTEFFIKFYINNELRKLRGISSPELMTPGLILIFNEYYNNIIKDDDNDYFFKKFQKSFSKISQNWKYALHKQREKRLHEIENE